MNKQLSIVFLGLSLLTNTSRVQAKNWRKCTPFMVFLAACKIYYSNTQPTESVKPLSEDASLSQRIKYYIKYDLNMGQSKKVIGYTKQPNGDLIEKKIPATGFGKVYEGVKHGSKILLIPAFMLSISKSINPLVGELPDWLQWFIAYLVPLD